MHRLILLGGIHLESPPGFSLRRSVQARPLALLAILARSPGIPVTRERAASLIWPDLPMQRARRRLSDLVYIHRQELGRTSVRSVADRLQLAPEQVDSDAAAFEQALADQRYALAAELYTGPFLEGFILRGNRRFDGWVEGERRELESLYREALESVAADAEVREDWGTAVRSWRRLSAAMPTDSRVARCLMEALAHAGSVAGALQHAREHERRLRHELDLPAPPSLRELADALAAALDDQRDS